ncbi:MAG TPA: aldose 1-epimerase family protein [Cytophagaceae bacterium]
MVAIIINEFLKVTVKSSGAELISLKNTITNLEYLWQGDPAYWARRAPVLFPIVGRLKDHKLQVDGQSYTLPQHGFARDMIFDLVDHQDDCLTYKLKSSEETLKIYPFNFELTITYRLVKNKLVVTYEVKNTDDKTIYFSIGAHPAFRCPLVQGEKFEDYYLEFEKPETAERLLLTEGLFNGQTEPVLNNENILPLSYDLFDEKDAVVFKGTRSRTVSIKSKKSKNVINVDYSGFPYLGIWTKKAPFICIEPWYGLADKVDFNGEFKDKEGVRPLIKGRTFNCEFSIEIK